MACERDPLRSMRNAAHQVLGQEPKEVPMAIVGGLDIHRRQITYDWIDTDTGQARHGADPARHPC